MAVAVVVAVVERVVEGLVAVAWVVGDLGVAVDLGAPCTACCPTVGPCSARMLRTHPQSTTRRTSHGSITRYMSLEYAHSTQR